jgi:dolichyl-phosphate-mannose-protein mannosyltransferase
VIKAYYPQLLVLLLVGSFLIKLIFLGHPDELYFDEVYHGYTAKQYVHNNPDGYDPWGTAEEGKANEWTHPPLAKLLMAGSMLVAGENPVGWRLSSVLFGTLSIGMAALLSLELFKSKRASILTALLLSLEGLLFTQSRIAMNDVHFLFFGLTSIYCYLRWTRANNGWWMVASGLTLGLALASKWTALYIFGLIGLDFLVRSVIQWPGFKKVILFGFSLTILPAAVYVTAYFHYFLLGFTWSQWVELQKQMYWYHTNLTATHTYQSRPWQWVLNLRPVWYYTNYAKADVGVVSNIYNLANPVVLYGGIAAVAYAIYRLIRRWQRELWFSLLAYFILFLPWVFSPRIMFSYHYLPSIVWLAILLGWAADKGLKKDSVRYWIYGFLGLCLIWFVVFYPNMTGLSVPKSVFETIYTIIPSWR